MESKEIYWIRWLRLIDKMKKKYEVLPINAEYDASYMIIPGYNGLKINVTRSIKNLEKVGQWDEKQLVFEEVEPYISTNNLNPAPIYMGNSSKPMVSIMINVAWGNEYLQELLSILKENDVLASFFLDGSWLEKYPILGVKIRDDGHEIGSHAYSHPDMRKISTEDIIWQLRKTNEVIRKEIGIKPLVFTPPYGAFDERIVYLAFMEEMNTVLSSIDLLDWEAPKPEEVMQKVKANLKNGCIILIHPTKTALIVLPKIIEYLNEKKYKIGTVSDTISTTFIWREV